MRLILSNHLDNKLRSRLGDSLEQSWTAGADSAAVCSLSRVFVDGSGERIHQSHTIWRREHTSPLSSNTVGYVGGI
jgi:hypothetical protein